MSFMVKYLLENQSSEPFAQCEQINLAIKSESWYKYLVKKHVL